MDEQVFENFRAAKEKNVTVHDVDMKQWAFQVIYDTAAKVKGMLAMFCKYNEYINDCPLIVKVAG